MPPLYRYLLHHSSAEFVDRWCSAAIQKLGHFNSEELLNLAIAEYVAACTGETVEIASYGVYVLPILYRRDLDVFVAKASILREGAFVGESHAFANHFSMRLFRSGFGKIGFKAAVLVPFSSIPFYYGIQGQDVVHQSAKCHLNLVVLCSSLAVSCALRNQTVCSLVSWLALSLSCGQNRGRRHHFARNGGAHGKINSYCSSRRQSVCQCILQA